MTGLLWSQGAGWIYPTWVASGSSVPTYNSTGSVTYNKTTGAFSGFMWNDNVGFISMEGLFLDITPPDPVSNFKPFAASSSKVFTLTDPSPIVPGGSYTFNVENWDTAATLPIGSPTPSFTHDFRKAKQYYLKITDPFGNSSEGNVQVVADVPSDILNTTYQIASAMPNTYTGTFTESRVADATQTHSMSLKLRDQYGNPVKNESDSNGSAIKTVNVRVAFNNNVDKNQTLSIG